MLSSGSLTKYASPAAVMVRYDSRSDTATPSTSHQKVYSLIMLSISDSTTKRRVFNGTISLARGTQVDMGPAGTNRNLPLGTVTVRVSVSPKLGTRNHTAPD